jgi:hypothetical protein
MTEPTKRPHWLRVIPRIPFAPGVPVVRVTDENGWSVPVMDPDTRQTGVVTRLGCWSDEGVAREVMVVCDGDALIESKDNFVVDLTAPQGFAYALRHYMRLSTPDKPSIFTDEEGTLTAWDVWATFGIGGWLDHWTDELAAALAALLSDDKCDTAEVD